MKVEYFFYITGIVLLFATISYFSYNYLFSLTKELKSIILILLVIVFFFIGEVLKGREI
ncbi:MAG: hypothetical protein HYW22_02960 [Candidatus Aenigmarchaeota archaeon]|nr:hypothetical protein [Candidatus Aenigmarchaeota archaeon]